MILNRTALAREALLAATAATTLAALLAWLGPPGTDFAAHAYQRTVFLEHGFTLWNNFWYAGRYSFISYSVLYYPLAALLGIRLLAVATIATGALAFAVVLGREFGPAARWSSRTFAVVWAGIVLSAAFPFALGAALALLALWAVQARRLWRFALVAALTLAASPLAFLLLTLVLGGIALGGRPKRRVLTRAGLAVVAIGAAGVLLQRAFPGGGRYPFPSLELLAALAFCATGLAMTWGVERARVLRPIFVVYAAACVAAFVVPSERGPETYIRWLRGVGARYVVLTKAAPDYSARAEAALLRSGLSGLHAVLRTAQLTIYAVPSPQPLVTGPGPARVLTLSQNGVRLALARPGSYRLAIRYSAYWQTHGACVAAGKDGMTVITTGRAGVVNLGFDVNAGRLIAPVEGQKYRGCSQ